MLNVKLNIVFPKMASSPKYPNKKIHMAYIIDQLGIGGTEKQLKLLIDCLDRDKFKVSLFVLRGSTD